MAMTFACKLTCKACWTVVTFENERPDWKTYDYRVEQAEECEKAARFVAEHADIALRKDELFERYIWTNILPPFVWHVGQRDDDDVVQYRLKLSIPDPYRYVPCPVCDRRIPEPPELRA